MLVRPPSCCTGDDGLPAALLHVLQLCAKVETQVKYTKLETAVTHHQLGRCKRLYRGVCAPGQDQCAMSENGSIHGHGSDLQGTQTSATFVP
jgi:hypothetical protein